MWAAAGRGRRTPGEAPHESAPLAHDSFRGSPEPSDVWTFVLSRSTRIAAQALALTGVVAGALAVTVADTSVDVTVDGRTANVHAFGGTVADVLAGEGITVGEHDLVSPALTAAVHDGSDISVQYGRQLKVTTDGRARSYWTTARTVDEALAQLGVRADGAKLSVSRSLPLGRTGLAMTAATRKDVALVVGGKPLQRVTYGTTVAQVLREAKVTLGPLDRLSTTATSRVGDGSRVVVTRVARKAVAVPVALPFATTKVESADLVEGTTKVKTAGRPGTARATYVETWVDGRRTGRAATGRTVVAKPVARVVLVGTKQPESTEIPSGGGLNWAALADCESSGNPQAVNSNGHYGLYQFSLQTWRGVGGSGNPVNASVAEQTRRAQILYDRSGAGQWSCGRHLFD